MNDAPGCDMLMAIDRLSGRQRAGCRRNVARTSDERLVLATLNWPAFRPLACPHCNGRRLQRWGQAGGLQRYRCTACLRTCNPLTRTPLARLRRRDLWLGHATALREGASLRMAAQRLGVHHHTTFRWRHRWLAQPAGLQASSLSGMIAIAAVPFHATGERWPMGRRVAIDLDAASQADRARLPRPPLVQALILCDDSSLRADVLLQRLDGAVIAAALTPLLGAAPAVLCCPDTPAFAVAAQAIGLPHRLSDGRLDDQLRCDRASVRGHVERLTAWMQRFRGVSTRYLRHYLGWHRLLEREPAGPGLATWLRLAIGSWPTANADKAGGSRSGVGSWGSGGRGGAWLDVAGC